MNDDLPEHDIIVSRTHDGTTLYNGVATRARDGVPAVAGAIKGVNVRGMDAGDALSCREEGPRGRRGGRAVVAVLLTDHQEVVFFLPAL
jgi:hypothetical protein